MNQMICHQGMENKVNKLDNWFYNFFFFENLYFFD